MSSVVKPGTPPARVGLAWAVHGLTASGGVVGLAALLCIGDGRFPCAALLLLVALVIDSLDGTLARAAGVREILPGFDGRRLDDLVDYSNYVIVPAVFLVASGSVSSWWWAALPVLASAYGFCQVEAKTRDDFFLGFPSYWNIVAIYAWKLELAPATTEILVAGLSAAVFVPLKYVYPSRMTRLWKTTNVGAALWVAALAAAIALPERLGTIPLAELSLVYPAYYLGVSLWLGGLRRGAS